MVCTFFGHRNCPASIESALRLILTDLIENKTVDHFYVGNHGGFDALVHKTLKDLAKIYPIQCHQVLAFIPGKKGEGEKDNTFDTLVPEGIEFVPPKFAISWRNRWMIRRADYVVTYVHSAFGGAAQFKKAAQRQNKIVINIGEE